MELSNYMFLFFLLKKKELNKGAMVIVFVVWVWFGLRMGELDIAQYLWRCGSRRELQFCGRAWC